MRILFISPFDLVADRLWGPSARIFSLAREARRMGHHAVVAGGDPYQGERVKDKEGVPFAYLPTAPFHRYPYPDAVREEIARKWKPFMLPRAALLAVKRGMALTDIARLMKADVLYMGRTFPETAVAALLARRLTKLPLVVDWDDVEGVLGFSAKMRLPLSMQYLYTGFETWFAKKADAVVAASRFLREYALDSHAKPENVFCAPTYGDEKLFAPTADRPFDAAHPTLFYAGNLRSDNGLDLSVLLHTFQKVREAFSGAKLLIAGGGDLLERDGRPGELPRLARELGVAAHVEFTGDVPHARMPALLARADICLALFPVNVITLAKSPIKVYEYLCAGKPVVARNVGEMEGRIIDGENGFLVHTGSPDECAAKIVAALRDPASLKRVGVNARRSVEERFNWRFSAEEALKACARARENRPSR